MPRENMLILFTIGRMMAMAMANDIEYGIEHSNDSRLNWVRRKIQRNFGTRGPN
jgi:hypothetical protein